MWSVTLKFMITEVFLKMLRVCELHIVKGPLAFSFASYFGLIFKASLGLKLIIVSVLSFSTLMTLL